MFVFGGVNLCAIFLITTVLPITGRFCCLFASEKKEPQNISKALEVRSLSGMTVSLCRCVVFPLGMNYSSKAFEEL